MPGTTNLDVIQAVPRVATLIYQTHQLWQEIKEVPEGIQGLVDHLKALEPIFADIEDQFNQDEASTPFKNCLDLSRKAHDSLGALVADMRTQLQASKRVRRKRIRSWITRAMLRKLSSNTQTLAVRVQPQHQNQISRPPSPQLQHKMPSAELKEDDILVVPKRATVMSKKMADSYTFSLSRYAHFALTYARATGAWQAQMQLPAWLPRSIYELVYTPSVSGWTYTYRVYNIVPNDSEIMMRIKAGDLAGVQELFSTKKASPFDRSIHNATLLHEAASHEQYEICQLLLNLGLQTQLDEGDRPGSTALANVAVSVVTDTVGYKKKETDTMPRKIAKLFALYLQEPDALPADRLLDFVREYSTDDLEVRIFQELFMPSYYFRMIRDRLEVVRLGAFIVQSPKTLKRFLSEDGVIKQADVHQSTREQVSLVHSAAIAFGCRYPEELVTCQKPVAWWRAYHDPWASFVVNIASMANEQDLHTIEEVVPWDAYQVTSWRGTPLLSVIGAALCYLCPQSSLYHWDTMFQGCMREWLSLLKEAGVDLMAYGREEVNLLRKVDDNTRGAFDAKAIERSRHIARRRMIGVEPVRKLCRTSDDMTWNETHWIPLRIIDLEIGPDPEDWKILWAPEFEYMAYEFWDNIEKSTARMPGAWVE
ncbi:hypothetical protein TgHK011_009679 [Trichoderma gracile]|nr:hypothetical protein TgHK011_009679 [Trichoderma gracile]